MQAQEKRIIELKGSKPSAKAERWAVGLGPPRPQGRPGLKTPHYKSGYRFDVLGVLQFDPRVQVPHHIDRTTKRLRKNETDATFEARRHAVGHLSGRWFDRIPKELCSTQIRQHKTKSHGLILSM